jgi:hypothetical protein
VEQVVVDREASGLRLGRAREALGALGAEVASRLGSVVAGDLALPPAEVVDRRDVGQEVEALLVPEMRARLDEPSGIDDERRLAVRLLALDEPRDSFESQLATPRIS